MTRRKTRRGARSALGILYICLVAISGIFGHSAVAEILPSPTEALLHVIKGTESYHTPPQEAEIPKDKYGDEVRFGKKIFIQTYQYARRYTGNGLSCSNCHLDEGRRANAAPLWAAFGMYPLMSAREDRTVTFEERIQQCFRFALNGIAPARDAPEMRALVSYAHFLSRGVSVGKNMPGRGFPQVIRTGQDPNHNRGIEVYQKKCARCHGIEGDGILHSNGGYEIPPLWGSDSFNAGSAMATLDVLAGFIKANMPPGEEWALTDQESLDVAAYIRIRPRPWDPRKGFLRGIIE